MAVTTDESAAGSARASRAALADLLAPVRATLATGTALAFVAAVASVVPFVCVAEIARELLATGPVDDDRVWALVRAAVAAFAVRLACFGLAATVTHFADNTLQLAVRRRMAARLAVVPLGWFTDRTSGAVKKVLQDDVQALHHLVAHARIELVMAVTAPLAAFGYLCWVDWRLALVTIAPVPVYAGAYVLMMRGYAEKMAQYSAGLARINAAVIEFVNGIAVVKTFGQTRRAHDRFVRAADDFADFFGQWAGPMTRVEAVAAAVVAPATMLLVTLVAGTAFVGAGWLTPVDVLPFALLGVGLTAPVLSLGYGAQEIRAARDAASRIVALLATPALPEPAVPRRPDGHRVELDDVTFAYDGTNPVVEGVSAVLEPGTLTALVGPSGSGKSTLARLVARFHDVDGGAVRIGGVDVRDISATDLYRHVGFVFQEVRLLHASVRDNIALARPEADAAEVEKAARAARIHERILALPRGYDSVVGEDAHLSGGEAQRVCIARALLADTPVIVLDEATAFTDPESEAAITDALSELAAGRTVLVVAHRLSTVVGADQILVVVQGRLVERGRHDQLVALGGAYARMWRAHERAGATGRAGGVPVQIPARTVTAEGQS